MGAPQVKIVEGYLEHLPRQLERLLKDGWSIAAGPTMVEDNGNSSHSLFAYTLTKDT